MLCTPWEISPICEHDYKCTHKDTYKYRKTKITSSLPVVFVYNTNKIQIQENKNDIFPTCCLCLLLDPLSNRVLRLFLLLQFFFEICWKYSNKYSAENILQVCYVNIVVVVFGNDLVLNNLPCPTAASRNGWLLEAGRIWPSALSEVCSTIALLCVKVIF